MKLNSYDLSKQLTELKKEHIWLNEINSQSLIEVLRNQDSAFTNFFNHRAQYPKFKSIKKANNSAKFPQNHKLIEEKSLLRISKFQEGIKIVIDRVPKGELRNVIVTKSKTGKYFASLLYNTGCAVPEIKNIKDGTSVGVDLGLKHFVILSDGDKIHSHKFLKSSQARLAVLQRRLSRKTKGSNRRRGQILKIARVHEHIVNQRKDFQHKLSTSIVNKYDTVCMENLSISNMVKNHSLAGAISDAAWFQFTQMIKYKCDWYGKNFLQIGRFEPSSKMCTCGVINRELSLSDREWTCDSCGVTHDRDILAANNIKFFALRNAGQGMPKEDVELPTLVGAMKRQVS